MMATSNEAYQRQQQQHRHQQQQQVGVVVSTPINVILPLGSAFGLSRSKAGAKKRRINFFKYILSFTIFRRWKTVHKAEECPSPGGFAMVLQNASGIATTTPAIITNPAAINDAGGYEGDGNGNGDSCILSPSSSSASIRSSTTDCNRNQIVTKSPVGAGNYHHHPQHHDSSQLVNHSNNNTNSHHHSNNSNNKSTVGGNGKRQHPASSGGKGVCASFFSSVRSSQQQPDAVGGCRRTKPVNSGCRMSMST
uniref:Uncharacterized protein n=1 Tax=Anopheles dirus TaxID=7168 RepID=A0A182NNW3_9DIPT